MKKEIYIALFAILGFLVHFLIFESVATLYIGHSLKDFPGLVYQLVAPAWLALGLLSGFLQGRFFWQKIYVEKIRKETVFKWFSNKR
jgi:hypothetical protein